MRTLKISLLVFILSITLSAQKDGSGRIRYHRATGLHAVDCNDQFKHWIAAAGECGTIIKTTNGGNQLDYSG